MKSYKTNQNENFFSCKTKLWHYKPKSGKINYIYHEKKIECGIRNKNYVKKIKLLIWKDKIRRYTPNTAKQLNLPRKPEMKYYKSKWGNINFFKKTKMRRYKR